MWFNVFVFKTTSQREKQMSNAVKDLEKKIKEFEIKISAIRKQIEPLENQKRKLQEIALVKKAKHKVGQKVEYRLNGCNTVRFGTIRSINAKSLYRIGYLVERLDSKGNPIGFGNEVQETEIFGCSYK